MNIISNVSGLNIAILGGTVNVKTGKYLSSTTGDVMVIKAAFTETYNDNTVNVSFAPAGEGWIKEFDF